MDVYQCPACELKFILAAELSQHISLEHPDFSLEDKTVAGLEAAHKRRQRDEGPASPS